MTATISDQTSKSIGEWDLTSRISPFLDLHMIVPLLEYVDSVIIKVRELNKV